MIIFTVGLSNGLHMVLIVFFYVSVSQTVCTRFREGIKLDIYSQKNKMNYVGIRPEDLQLWFAVHFQEVRAC